MARRVWVAMIFAFASCGTQTQPSSEGQPTMVEPRVTAEVVKPPFDAEKAYLRWRDASAETSFVNGPRFADAVADLKRVTSEADDRHLRANAGLMLGAMFEAREDWSQAIDYYRLATKYVPDEAAPHQALAWVLAQRGDYAEAEPVQAKATELDPDNLRNWLVLGEVRIKSGDKEGAAEAYLGYEQRRKGLIDGLTLADPSGKPWISTEERLACAQALAEVPDQGTGIALVYALKYDSEAVVRAEIARLMGRQRLVGYKTALEYALANDSSASVQEQAREALAEIERDPAELPEEQFARGEAGGDLEPPASVPEEAKALTEGDTPTEENAGAPTKADAGMSTEGKSEAPTKADAGMSTEGQSEAPTKADAGMSTEGKSEAPTD